jgi:hypothetical protein
MRHKNLIYLLNGSIGDFLMVLFLLDSVWNGYPEDTKPRLCIVTPRNKDIFLELAEKYPHIQIYECGNLCEIFFLVIHFLFRKNTVITPPTTGFLPLHQKLLGWILSRMHGSALYGFDDGKKINTFLYTDLIPFRTDILIIDLLFSLLLRENISYLRQTLHLKLPSIAKGKSFGNEYIVFHPFGSSGGKSLTEEKLLGTLHALLESYPNHTVYITGALKDLAYTDVVASIGNPRIKNVVGKLSMNELCHLINGCSLYVGVNTGITHLACVLEKKCLVISEQGTHNWLPYYNANATIIYQIKNDTGSTNEGREYLEAARNGRVRFLDRVPLSVIEGYIRKI